MQRTALLNSLTLNKDKDWNWFASEYLIEGILKTTDLQVAQSATPAMSVAVGTGRCLLDVLRTSTSDQIKILFENTTSATLTINPNTSGTNRIDAIIVAIKKSYVDATTPYAIGKVGGTGEDLAQLLVIDGTGATALSDGAIDTALATHYSETGTNTNWYRLANITVPDSATTITNSNITNVSLVPSLQNINDITVIGTITGQLDADGNTITNVADPVNGSDAATMSWVSSNFASSAGIPMISQITVPQTGCSNNDVVYWDGSTLKPAKADNLTTARPIGIISNIAGAVGTLNIFGYLTGFTGLAAGSIYYLSDSTAGAISTTAGAISVKMGIAKETTSLMLDIDWQETLGETSISKTYGGTIVAGDIMVEKIYEPVQLFGGTGYFVNAQVSNPTKVGQTFTPDRDWNCDGCLVEIALTGQVNVNLYNTSAGLPTGAALRTSSLVYVGLGWYQTNWSAITLTSGTKYAIVVEYVGYQASVYGSSTSVYTGGNGVSYSGSWSTLTSDFHIIPHLLNPRADTYTNCSNPANIPFPILGIAKTAGSAGDTGLIITQGQALMSASTYIPGTDYFAGSYTYLGTAIENNALLLMKKGLRVITVNASSLYNNGGHIFTGSPPLLVICVANSINYTGANASIGYWSRFNSQQVCNWNFIATQAGSSQQSGVHNSAIAVRPSAGTPPVSYSGYLYVSSYDNTGIHLSASGTIYGTLTFYVICE